MSVSSLSDALPTDAELESGLRNAVRDAFRRGDRDSITVKKLRTKVETKLGLDDGFFKEDSTWKEKSKSIIQSEVDAHDDAEPPSSAPTLHNGKRAKGKIVTQPQSQSQAKSKKRKSDEPPPPKPRKKRKSSPDNEGDSDAIASAPDSPQRSSQEESGKPKAASKVEDSASEQEKATSAEELNASESEMSVVLDEDPKPKRRKQSSSGSKPKAKKADAAKSKKSADTGADPDAEEIKRLQGWLVKCGIRKMWYKELAPYDTPKLKIKHLKEMLADAGMTGRYSKEKADQIRDQRELKADLEAVQEGEKTWGKSQSEDEKSDSDRKPRRRLARGLQGLDFLNDDDGEETD